MKYFLPLHINGDNRGCEAITKATALILSEDKSNIIALSSNYALDKRLGLDNYVTLMPTIMEGLHKKLLCKILTVFMSDPYRKNALYYSARLDSFLNKVGKGDIMLSTGGDMMCYSDNQVVYTNNYLSDRGIKTILWGCSIGEENLTLRKLDTLKKFSLIYVRESFTERVLQKQGLKNVVFFPDPAFILVPELCQLPSCFAGNEVIGINLSNFVNSTHSLDSTYGRNIISLIDYVFQYTKYHIMLVPHVLWDSQDDRKISSLVFDKYKNSNKITVLNSDKFNYCQLRYIISKCSMFIGARTHSMISAYSTCVPALALGYSIKSKGIAADIGLDDKLVVDSKNLNNDNIIRDSFIYLLENHSSIKEHLKKTMPSYILRLHSAKEKICSAIF